MREGSVANPIGHLHDQSNTNKGYHLAIPLDWFGKMMRSTILQKDCLIRF